MTLNVVIDDERTFAGFPETVYLRNSKDALAFLAKHFADYQLRYSDELDLWLDHDLGNDDDIRIVVDFLCVAKVPGINFIRIHSQNPVSAELVSVLKSAGYLNCQKSSLPRL